MRIRPGDGRIYYWMRVRLTVNDSETVDLALLGGGGERTIAGVHFTTYQYFDADVLWYSHYDEFPAKHHNNSGQSVVARPQMDRETAEGWLLLNATHPTVKDKIDELGGVSAMGPKWPLEEA